MPLQAKVHWWFRHHRRTCGLTLGWGRRRLIRQVQRDVTDSNDESDESEDEDLAELSKSKRFGDPSSLLFLSKMKKKMEGVLGGIENAYVCKCRAGSVPAVLLLL